MSAGKKHMGRVAEWGAEHGCVVCGAPFDHVHHMLADRVPGRRCDDILTIPLCWDCHEGRDGIHGTRNRWKLRKISETQALAKTLEGIFYGKT